MYPIRWMFASAIVVSLSACEDSGKFVPENLPPPISSVASPTKVEPAFNMGSSEFELTGSIKTTKIVESSSSGIYRHE